MLGIDENSPYFLSSRLIIITKIAPKTLSLSFFFFFNLPLLKKMAIYRKNKI